MNLLRKLILLGVVASLPLPVFAQGTIVYVDPPDIVIGSNETSQLIDLNGDGVDDVRFQRSGGQLTAIPQGNGQLAAESESRAKAIREGEIISSLGLWQSRVVDPLLGDFGLLLASDRSFPSTGPFAGVDGYLGIRFYIGANRHYGWIRLDLDNGFPNQARGFLTEWAYNSTPNAPLAAGVVPEPSPLALAALGAGGLLFLRRLR